jgi:hypothetical protein
MHSTCTTTVTFVQIWPKLKVLTNFGKIHSVTHLMKPFIHGSTYRNVQRVGTGVVDEMYALAHLQCLYYTAVSDDKLCPYPVPTHVLSVVNDCPKIRSMEGCNTSVGIAVSEDRCCCAAMIGLTNCPFKNLPNALCAYSMQLRFNSHQRP